MPDESALLLWLWVRSMTAPFSLKPAFSFFREKRAVIDRAHSQSSAAFF
jgi:hypothetical protein